LALRFRAKYGRLKKSQAGARRRKAGEPLPVNNPTAAVPSDLKFSNRAQILAAFRDGGAFTANDVAASVGLSRQTVMKAIQFFLEKGILCSEGKAGSSAAGGKRPELFTLSSSRRFLCIDVWPFALNFSLMDFKGRLVDAITLRQSLPADVEQAMAMVGRLADDLLSRCRVPLDALSGVCLSTSGIVDYRTNTLRFSSISPSWGANIPVEKLLRPYFGPDTAIVVENVAKVTARSLLRDPELREKRVLTVFSAWGLSGCLIDRGRILNGGNSLIGEIGHMILDPEDDERCGCGSRGCFERLVGAERLRKRAAAAAGEFPGSALRGLPPGELTAKRLFDLSAAGDEGARAVVAELARLFAMAVRNVTLVFDPEEVVFQGDFAEADDWFVERFRACLGEFQYYPAGGPFRLRLDARPLAELSRAGACTILLDRFFGETELYE